MIEEKKISSEICCIDMQRSSKGKDELTFEYFNYILDNNLLGRKVIDLGTGHGKFSIICRDKGFIVTATDARPERIPFHEQNIKWVVEPVSVTDLKGYDTVLCLGLLYHLTLDMQIDLLRRIEDCHTLILNTHTAIIKNGKIENMGWKEKLSSVYRDGRIEGCIYKESNTLDELKGRPLAAFSNTDSFWHTLDSLVYVLKEYGKFSSIYMLVPEISEGRTFIVAKK